MPEETTEEVAATGCLSDCLSRAWLSGMEHPSGNRRVTVADTVRGCFFSKNWKWVCQGAPGPKILGNPARHRTFVELQLLSGGLPAAARQRVDVLLPLTVKGRSSGVCRRPRRGKRIYGDAGRHSSPQYWGSSPVSISARTVKWPSATCWVTRFRRRMGRLNCWAKRWK